MNLIKSPEDILEFMDEIEYGYLGIDQKKHINSLQNFKENYITLSINKILEEKIGTCIEQVYLMHFLLDKLNIPNKMFCTRTSEIEDEHMHCFILYYDNNGVHQIEHPNGDRKGIYHFKNEEEAINNISEIYQKMYNVKKMYTTEFYEVLEGITFKEFNEYINRLDVSKIIR